MPSFWPPKMRRLGYAGAALFAGAAQPETTCPSWAHLGPKLLAISSCVLALSSAISSLSTYLGVYVQELLGLPSLDMAGYYSSLLLGSFTVGNLISSFAWGMVADRFGRKPVMLAGVIATGVFAITFGLSRTFASALVSMFLFGLFDSVNPMAKIMTAELLGPEKAVIGMAFLPGMRAVGSIIGPVVGGLLVRPAVRYPSRFSSTGLFARYPFLLPNLVVALLAFGSLPFVLFFVPETLRVKRVGVVAGESNGANPRPPLEPNGFAVAKPRTSGEDTGVGGNGRSQDVETGNTKAALLDKRGHHHEIGDYSGGCGIGQAPLQQQLQQLQLRPGNAATGDGSPLWGQGGLLSSRRMRLLLLLVFLVKAMELGFTQTYPLWLLASKGAGGLDWAVSKIGEVLGCSGVGDLLFQFAVYPALIKTIGIVWLVRGSGVLGAFVFLAVPDFQRLAWSNEASYVLGIIAVVSVRLCASVVETALTLAWTNSVPVHVRGKVGGAIAVSISFGSVVGPPALSSLMAWSLEAPSGRGNDWLLDYHAVFVVEAVLMVVVTALGREALTLETLTFPIQNSYGMDYGSLSQSSGETTTPSSSRENLAEAATSRRVDSGQRRSNPPAG